MSHDRVVVIHSREGLLGTAVRVMMPEPELGLTDGTMRSLASPATFAVSAAAYRLPLDGRSSNHTSIGSGT